MNIYLLKYNNYYNRKFKKEETVVAYTQSSVYSYFLKDANFNPNDGIYTTHVFGTALSSYNGNGDYAIVVDKNNVIVSRWFIIEARRERAGQWTLELRRDVVADYWEEIKNADCFIEKATLTESDALIFNKEDMQVNQILTSQTLIKDQTQCGWFVGYYAKNAPEISGTVDTNELRDEAYEDIGVEIENWEYYKYSVTPFNGYLTKENFIVRAQEPFGAVVRSRNFGYDKISGAIVDSTGADAQNDSTLVLTTGTPAEWASKVDENIDTINGYIKEITGYHTTEEYLKFSTYNGKTIKAGSKYYIINILRTHDFSQKIENPQGALLVKFSEMTSQGWTNVPNAETYAVDVTCPAYTLIFTEREELNINYTIPTSNKLVTENEPFNIFAIPYGDITIIDETEGGTEITTSGEIGLSTISSILGSHGGVSDAGSRVYDAQIIGYCPVPTLISDGFAKEIRVTSEKQCSWITTTDADGNIVKKGAIFHVPYSSFTTTVGYFIPSTDKKITTQCDFYRLIAPDQSSYFDFDAAKNNGVNYIDIDVNLKPFNAYIHANPNFKNLYGNDYNTGRGLIYGSNLSLSRALNSFTEYQIQNSQYQNIFDRNVQNMEVYQKYQRMQDYIGAGMGALQGAVSGAFTGSVMSPGIGTAVGAVAGGLASVGAGIGDVIINEKLRNEALDYTKDQFSYNLQNIKAQPNTLSRITALTQNNTIFIAVEYYTCTEREKLAFANKIAWNGMTVMAIGKISEYLNNTWQYGNIKSKGYIKAKLIRLEGINEDFHVINAIASELDKGIYYGNFAE